MVEDMLFKLVFNRLWKLVIVCCELCDCGGLFHSVGEAIAKPCLPNAFQGQVEERDSRCPLMRILLLIKDEKVGRM